jgi:hypothetical protein
MNGARTAMLIGWPSFLVACGLEFAVFALIDPAELHWRGNLVELPRTAIYSLGFALFWVAAALASALTLLLARPASQVNQNES